jgi:hypothetical protein
MSTVTTLRSDGVGHALVADGPEKVPLYRISTALTNILTVASGNHTSSLRRPTGNSGFFKSSITIVVQAASYS